MIAFIALAATVILHWTAPGDDGTVGTAAEYDIRYAPDSATVVNWTNAVQCTGEPAPRVAGAAETYSFTLGNGTWFVGLKARDEASNWSGISNIPRVDVDTVPPDAIIDLRVGP